MPDAARARRTCPAGRATKIKNITPNVIASRHSERPKATASVSTAPMMKPPTTAPVMLPMPPRMITAEPFELDRAAHVEDRRCCIAGRRGSPAAPPSSRGDEERRRDRPFDVDAEQRRGDAVFGDGADVAAQRRRAQHVAEHEHQHDRRDPKMARLDDGEGHGPESIGGGLPPSTNAARRRRRCRAAMAPMMIATPIDEISGTSVPALRRRSGANATRSSRSENPAAISRQHERCPERQPHAMTSIENERTPRSCRSRRAPRFRMSSTPKTERVADREQRVDGAEEEAVDELLSDHRQAAFGASPRVP